MNSGITKNYGEEVFSSRIRYAHEMATESTIFDPSSSPIGRFFIGATRKAIGYPVFLAVSLLDSIRYLDPGTESGKTAFRVNNFKLKKDMDRKYND